MKKKRLIGLAVIVAVIGVAALAVAQSGWFTESRAMYFKNIVRFAHPVTFESTSTPIMSDLTASKPVFTSATKELTSSGTMPVNQGGTGLTSYAVGDILYASAATTIGKLADVAAGRYLRSGGIGAAPVWSTVVVPNAATEGDLVYASATNVLDVLPDVAQGQVLISGGVASAPSWSAAPTTATHGLTTPRGTSGSGTGVTVDDAGSLRTQVYKVTVAKENFTSAAVSHDLVIWTAPAKSIIHSVLANVSEAFVCGAVCTTATLSATLGVAAAGVDYLESFDIDAATGWFGDADAEVGSKLDIAANTNGGYPIPAGGAFTMRGTSGTGNWGDGASATNLTSGSLTFYILYSVLP